MRGTALRRLAPTILGSLAGAAPLAAQRAEGAPAEPPSDLVALLPHDLSPWSMFLSADAVVKGVIVGLAIASLATWTLGIAKGLDMTLAKRRARKGARLIDEAPTLDEARRALADQREALGPVAAMVEAAPREAQRSAGLSPEGVKERLALTLQRIEAQAARDMARGAGLLATIGAIAPFVGLFGTVWGIMNAFIGISRSHATNLAVVAPGIAEALLATAVGLAAAIPAVIVYNVFARGVAGYRAVLADAAAAVLQHASRHLERGALAPAVEARRAGAALHIARAEAAE